MRNGLRNHIPPTPIRTSIRAKAIDEDKALVSANSGLTRILAQWHEG